MPVSKYYLPCIGKALIHISRNITSTKMSNICIQNVFVSLAQPCLAQEKHRKLSFTSFLRSLCSREIGMLPASLSKIFFISSIDKLLSCVFMLSLQLLLFTVILRPSLTIMLSVEALAFKTLSERLACLGFEAHPKV